MIKLFRIDERLIHGQIAIKWSRHTGVDSIVVANDHAAANVMIQKSLKMAAGIKTVIKSIDDAIKTLSDPRCEPLKVLVLVNSPEDALKMAKQVKGIPFINVGNYGRVAPKKEGKERKRFDNNLYCDTDEEATDGDRAGMHLSDYPGRDCNSVKETDSVKMGVYCNETYYSVR